MNMNDRRLYRTCASDFRALQRAAGNAAVTANVQ